MCLKFLGIPFITIFSIVVTSKNTVAYFCCVPDTHPDWAHKSQIDFNHFSRWRHGNKKSGRRNSNWRRAETNGSGSRSGGIQRISFVIYHLKFKNFCFWHLFWRMKMEQLNLMNFYQWWPKGFKLPEKLNKYLRCLTKMLMGKISQNWRAQSQVLKYWGSLSHKYKKHQIQFISTHKNTFRKPKRILHQRDLDNSLEYISLSVLSPLTALYHNS